MISSPPRRPSRNRSFHHREVFGQVGFGTGGWDSDYPNSMLEILRVVITNCDENQRYIEGGVEQVPRGLWKLSPPKMVHWPKGTSLERLHNGAPRPGVVRIARSPAGHIAITDRWGTTKYYDAVLVACQSWLLTTQHQRRGAALLAQALDGARPHALHAVGQDLRHGRPAVLEGEGSAHRPRPDEHDAHRPADARHLSVRQWRRRPGVICLSYSWMSDALKMLPLPVDKRVRLALDALKRIYPSLDIESHIIGDPITVSWETDPNFLGAFKGALPGHYRYNHRMYCQFMQDDMPPEREGHLHRRRRRVLDSGLGRGRGADRAQCGVGNRAPSRRRDAAGTIRGRATVSRS